MASKFGLAGGIPERRVRPIWDAVDSRQFKHAHKLCAALLAKFPSSPYALALKALISERMGKTDEALAVCLDAKEKLFSQNAILIDDLTLSTLQIVFQRLDRLDLATSCYEHACGKYPNNLEVIMGLFNCYVREYSFVKQQQTAIKMYKIVGEERFLLWAVCSIQLQVFCSNGGEKLLSLAEALLKKHISSHSLHEPEALVIYISVLEQQAKYRDALEILSGDLGSLITIEADKLRIQGRLLARACDYAAAADIFQKVLESCPDDWESFLHYLGCLLEEDMNWPSQMAKDQIYSSNSIDSPACKGSHLIEEVFDERISSALSFVEKLQSTVSTDFVRCPYLATIEIERRRRLKGKADDGKLLEALLDYFHRFSHLSNFTSDVEIYLRLLTDSEKASVLENFVQNSQSTLTSPLKTLGQAITVFKVQEVLGVNMTLPVIELEGTALRMVEMYCKNLPLSRDLDPQENMHGEELLSMASGVLVLLFWRTRSLGYLLEAILVLEFGLTIRCNVWQYKILLLHLYSYIGALPLAYEWYGTLDVKNILLESVSHHIVPHMLRSPFWSETADLLREYLKFMDDYLREAADLTFLAYRHRNYSKVIEFVQFKERLQHSNQYLMARLDASVLQLKEKADNLEEVESILESVNNGTQLLELSNEEKLKSITFNEDLQSRPWWSPASNVNYLSEPFDGGSLCRENSHKLDKKEGNTRKLIERKSLLPRLVYLSVQTSPSFLKEAVVSNGSIPDSNSSQLKNLLERCASNLGFTFNDALRFIDEVARGQKPFKAFGSDVLDWVNFAIFVNAWNSGSYHSTPPSGVGCNSSSWCVVDNLVKTSIIDQLTHAQPVLTTPGSNFPILVQLVSESFSWHILVIQSCVRSLVPQGKKKKKSNTLNSPNVPHGQAARASIECLINAIQEVCRWLGGQVNSSEDENLDVLFSHVQNKEHEEGPGHVLQLLQENASVDNSDLGERISGAMQSWSSPTVVRKLIEAQKYQLSKFHLICASKLKMLETLKQSILG